MVDSSAEGGGENFAVTLRHSRLRCGNCWASKARRTENIDYLTQKVSGILDLHGF